MSFAGAEPADQRLDLRGLRSIRAGLTHDTGDGRGINRTLCAMVARLVADALNLFHRLATRVLRCDKLVRDACHNAL